MKTSRNVVCGTCRVRAVSRTPVPRYKGTTCGSCAYPVMYQGEIIPTLCYRCASEKSVCAYCHTPLTDTSNTPPAN